MVKYSYKETVLQKIKRGLFGTEIHEKIGRGIKKIPVGLIVKKAPVSEVKKQLAMFVSTAFALTAALFWNDAIKGMITSVIPKEGTWPYLLAAAIVVTLIAVFVTTLIARTTKE